MSFLQKTSAGVIEQTGSHNIIFGSRSGGQHQKALNDIEKVMQAAGIEATNSDSIEKELWKKFLLIIAFAGMTALCRSTIGPIVTDPGTNVFVYALLKRSRISSKKTRNRHK